MARLLYTVDDLVSEVRGMLDEENTDAVSTSTDILPALNRGLNFAFDIYARSYPEPILKYSTLDLVNGTAEYTIPEDCFEDRVLKLEITIPQGSLSSQEEVQRISFRDISEYESPSKSSKPQYFCIYGRTIRLVPTPDGAYDGRLWYLREPETLVLRQGRITNINSGSLYVDVDTLGSSLSANVDDLASYVNIIDGQTGEIKSSLQIQTLTTATKRITFRSSPSQSSVLGRTIASTVASTIQRNDYVCLIQGTCVPFYGSPTNNFLVQFAVAELTRKMGGNASTEQDILRNFEQQVSRSGYSRGNIIRIRKVNPIWSGSKRRSYPRLRSD